MSERRTQQSAGARSIHAAPVPPDVAVAAGDAVDGRVVRLGVDIGGTGVKGATVDVTEGVPTVERVRLKTPHPARVEPVVEVVTELGLRFPGTTPVGVTFPGVVIDGVIHTAANMHPSWVGVDAEAIFRAALGRPVTVLNDADAAGVAEVAFGAARGATGVTLVLTLGTGIGSALFLNGHLLPNTELGHLEIRGKDAEHRASAVVRERKNLSWHDWAERLQEYLETVERLLAPDLIVLGGGVSAEAEKFLSRLTTRAHLVPATLANRAGIVGAAMAAHQRT